MQPTPAGGRHLGHGDGEATTRDVVHGVDQPSVRRPRRVRAGHLRGDEPGHERAERRVGAEVHSGDVPRTGAVAAALGGPARALERERTGRHRLVG